MKTIVVSDTALAGISYRNTVEGLNDLIELQEKGNKIVLVSNSPDYSFCQVGAKNMKYRLSFQDFSNITRNSSGIDIILNDNGQYKEDITLQPDYTIVGNGISILDKEDKVIYEDSFIDKKVLSDIEYMFHELGYTSLLENMDVEVESDDEFKCKKIVDKYKFLTPTRIEKAKNDQVYAVVCDSRVSFMDNLTIDEIAKVSDSITGCVVDGRPFIYQKQVNKLKAFKNLLRADSTIDIEDTIFVLDSITDNVLMSSYPDKSYCLSDRFPTHKYVSKEESLNKVLQKTRSN